MALEGVSIGIFIGFIVCASYNVVGILVFTRFFTARGFFEAYPEAFSREGCVGVMLWGLAYLSVCTTYMNTPYTVLLFALEKLVYVIMWIVFLKNMKKSEEKSFSKVQNYS
jgi:hypothetical protein